MKMGEVRIVDYRRLRTEIMEDAEILQHNYDKPEVYAMPIYKVTPAFVITTGVVISYSNEIEEAFYSFIGTRMSYEQLRRTAKALGVIKDEENIMPTPLAVRMALFYYKAFKKHYGDIVELTRGFISIDGWKPEDVVDYF